MQFVIISSIQDHSWRLKCISLSFELGKQRYGDVAYIHAREKREVWEEKSSAQVIRAKYGLRIRRETDIVHMFLKKKKKKLQLHWGILNHLWEAVLGIKNKHIKLIKYERVYLKSISDWSCSRRKLYFMRKGRRVFHVHYRLELHINLLSMAIDVYQLDINNNLLNCFVYSFYRKDSKTGRRAQSNLIAILLCLNELLTKFSNASDWMGTVVDTKHVVSPEI